MIPVSLSLCLAALLSSGIASSDLVTSFSEAFSHKLETDKVGSSLLDLTKVPPAEAGKAFQSVLLDLFRKDGDPVGGGDDLAQEDEETVRQNFDQVPPSELATALGDLYGNTLQRRDLLTEGNASELGSKLAEEIIEVAEKIGTATSKDKWQAIVAGAVKFYSSFGLNEKEYAQEMTQDFAKILGCYVKKC